VGSGAAGEFENLVRRHGSVTFRSWDGKALRMDSDTELTFYPDHTVHMFEWGFGLGSFKGSYSVGADGFVVARFAEFGEEWPVMVVYRDGDLLKLRPRDRDQDFVMGSRGGATLPAGKGSYWPFRMLTWEEEKGVLEMIESERKGAGGERRTPTTAPRGDASATIVASFGDYDGALRSAAFSPDGKLLATATVHRTVVVWDWQKKKSVLNLEREGSLVVIMPDSRTLAVSNSGILSTWDLVTGKRLLEFGRNSDANSFAPTGREGELLCGGLDPGMSLWDVRSGTMTRGWNVAEHGVRCVAVSPGGKFAVSGSDDGIVRVWDLGGGDGGPAERVRLGGGVRWWDSVAISPDGRYVLASSSDDKCIRLWDVQARTIQRRFKASARSARCTAFSPDGNRFLFTNTQVAHLWDLQGDREVCQLKGHEVEIDAVCFSPNGQYAATAGGLQDFTGARWDTSVRVWRLPAYVY
jgi:WD40 repeat protein